MTADAKKAKVAKDHPSEKRRATRVQLKARVDYELLSEDTFLFEYTSNVSRGGIFLATRNPLPIGTKMSMRFALPDDGRVVVVTGRVQWVNEYRQGKKNLNPGMGIEFIDLKEEDKEEIIKLIKRKALLTDE